MSRFVLLLVVLAVAMVALSQATPYGPYSMSYPGGYPYDGAYSRYGAYGGGYSGPYGGGYSGPYGGYPGYTSYGRYY